MYILQDRPLKVPSSRTEGTQHSTWQEVSSQQMRTVAFFNVYQNLSTCSRFCFSCCQIFFIQLVFLHPHFSVANLQPKGATSPRVAREVKTTLLPGGAAHAKGIIARLFCLKADKDHTPQHLLGAGWSQTSESMSLHHSSLCPTQL